MNYPSLRLSNFIESISLKKKEMNYKNILKHRLTTLNRHAEKKSASLFIEEEKRLIIKNIKLRNYLIIITDFFPRFFSSFIHQTITKKEKRFLNLELRFYLQIPRNCCGRDSLSFSKECSVNKYASLILSSQN